MLTDYRALAPHERKVLRSLFADSSLRAQLPDWEDNARMAVAVFRIDVARSGGSREAAALAAELQASSARRSRDTERRDGRTAPSARWVRRCPPRPEA